MDWEYVYLAHGEDVYRYVLKLCGDVHVAEDITSETFLKAVRAINTFEEKCSLRVWLCEIAKNTYFTYIKKKKREMPLPQEMPSEESLEEKLTDKLQALTVHKALHLLDGPYKEVFTLRLFSELTFKDIGEIFEKNEAWARVVFFRAKQKIKEKLQDEL